MNSIGLCRTLDRALGLGDCDAPTDDDWWSTEEWCEEIAKAEAVLARAAPQAAEDVAHREFGSDEGFALDAAP